MICVLTDRAVLELSGDDRVGFLQGLVSNDVSEAAPGRAVWAGLLTPQGKWLADFFIQSDGSRLLLDVEAGQADMLATKLLRFRLRAKVTIAPTALRVVAGWDVPMPACAAPDPRLPEAGWRWLTIEAVSEDAGMDAYERHRLGLGLPGGSRDMESGKTTLLEAGFGELNGVSWTKGCYMGQELTARTKYRGLLKRRLVPVLVEGALPAPGTPVLDGALDVGEMRSGVDEGADGLGLALLRVEAVRAVRLSCGGAVLVPRVPGWMEAAPE